MKTKPLPLSRAYLAALRQHLKQGSDSSLHAARELGLRALKLGLETLDLAKIHEEAMVTLVSRDHSESTREERISLAAAFFAEAITPIEETHRGLREVNVQLKGMIQTLTRRTEELAASNKELKQEITQCKTVEDSLRTSELASGQLLEESRHMQEELRSLSRRLLSVQEEERKRISRELHDVVAQTLTGINVRLAALKSQTTANAKDIHKKIATTLRLVQKSVEIVHRFARDLRPTVLDDLGLVPAVDSHLKAFRKTTGLHVDFSSYEGIEKLDNPGRTVLYRVVQEALANVAQHAKASHVTVDITARGGMVCMEIHDDGKGFLVEDVVFDRSGNRLGLLGMRERVEMVGGIFCVESAPGRETTIKVEIPLAGVSASKRLAKQSGGTTLKSS